MFILKTFISQILSLICFICGCQAIKVCDIYIFSVLSKKIDYLFRKEKVTTVTTLFSIKITKVWIDTYATQTNIGAKKPAGV